MNRYERGGSGEARVRYLDHDFQVLSPGNYVICSVTGEFIALDDLKYWSVSRQEAYFDAGASLERELEADPSLRSRA